ncbi:hypothetical protein KKG46_05280 [Patescibacteria group bacterium]|nr:hypothetical protein [Patescibacteria group bacterium]
MTKRRLSAFKQNKLRVDKEMATVHKDFWFWVEHVVHWHIFLFVVIIILAFAYVFFDHNTATLASDLLVL